MTISTRSRTALSLVELLIVIAIIAILASLLLPAVATARSQAWTAACLSNLRQVGMAHIAFATDHHDQIPAPTYYTQPEPQVFKDYVPTSNKTWSCAVPQVHRHWYNKNHAWKFYMNWWALQGNDQVNNPGYNAHRENGYRMSMVINPSAAVICADFLGGGQGGYHRGRSNVVMVDGHAESQPDASRTMPFAAIHAYRDPAPTAYSRHFNSRPSDGGIRGYDF